MKAQTIDEGTDQNLDLLLCSIPYADQENFVRGGPSPTTFFSSLRVERIHIPLKGAIIGPPLAW